MDNDRTITVEHWGFGLCDCTGWKFGWLSIWVMERNQIVQRDMKNNLFNRPNTRTDKGDWHSTSKNGAQVGQAKG